MAPFWNYRGVMGMLEASRPLHPVFDVWNGCGSGTILKEKIKRAKLVGIQLQSRYTEATQENHLFKVTLGYVVS